jgi:histidyl-tRNA synthetase
LALVVGEDEAAKNVVGVKSLREEGEQRTLSHADLIEFLGAYVRENE